MIFRNSIGGDEREWPTHPKKRNKKTYLLSFDSWKGRKSNKQNRNKKFENRCEMLDTHTHEISPGN